MRSQIDLIYTHMKEVGPITPLIAFEEYNWVTYKSPLGQTKRYKEYRLA